MPSQSFNIYIDDVAKVVGAPCAKTMTALGGYNFTTGGIGQTPDGEWIDDFKEYKLP